MKSQRKYSLTKRILLGMATVLIVTVVVLRLYLSVWLLDYVNNVLAHIDGYQGSVESINIDLYRGAYRINKLVLNKLNGHIPTPFVAIDVTDFSLQWMPLLHGRIVSSLKLVHPVINFAVNKSASQTGENVDWTKPIKDLMPIDINRVYLDNGAITYQDFSSTPNVDIFIHHMQGEVQNLRNVEDPANPLPSTLEIRGSSIGSGNLGITGRMNILTKMPNMNLLISLKDVNLPALNDYTNAYAAFDFKSGNFTVFSQLVTKDGEVSGYVKPLVTNLSVDILKSGNPLQIAWSSVVAVVLKVFTNISKDQFATRVDLQGKAGNIGTSIWPAIGGIFYNAFIEAMSKGFDQTENKNLTQPPKP